MKRIYTLLIFLLPLGLIAQNKNTVDPNGKNTFYYDNGKISSEGTLHNGKPDGYWKTYYDNGNLKSEGNRKNFQLDSVWKFYNEQGVLVTEFNYKAGKKNGLKKTYDPKDGYLLFAENYENELKQGNTIEYYPPASANSKQGKIKKTIPFVNGLEEGKGFEYSPENMIITITDYKMGFIQKEDIINRTDANGLKQNNWKEFYPTGAIKKEIHYWNDKIDGYLKEYLPNGNISKTTKYINGVIQTDVPELAKPDIKKEYYKNGVVKKEGAFVNGKAEGIHQEYSPEGTPTTAKIYTKGNVTAQGVIDTSGKKQGVWQLFYPNGSLRASGNFLNNRHVGEWIYYYDNGNIEQQGIYDKKGKAQGVWKWYYPCDKKCDTNYGNLKKTENYLDNLLEGEMIEYDDSSNVITKGQYVENEKEGLWTLKFWDYRDEGNYKAGKRDGEWKCYYVKSGKLRFKGSFIEDVPEGRHFFYYRDGILKQEGKYAAGLKEGEWNYYDESGTLVLTVVYKSDVEVSFDGTKLGK